MYLKISTLAMSYHKVYVINLELDDEKFEVDVGSSR